MTKRQPPSIRGEVDEGEADSPREVQSMMMKALESSVGCRDVIVASVDLESRAPEGAAM